MSYSKQTFRLIMTLISLFISKLFLYIVFMSQGKWFGSLKRYIICLIFSCFFFFLIQKMELKFSDIINWPTITFVFNLKSIKIKFDMISMAGHDDPFTLHFIVVIIISMSCMGKQALVGLRGNQHTSTYCRITRLKSRMYILHLQSSSQLSLKKIQCFSHIVHM